MTFVDARPPGLHAQYRAGSPFTLELNWPAGQLDGRTFTATLGAASLAVDVTGDVLTVSATAAQTAAAAFTSEFVLTEVLAGDDVATIVGTWSHDNRAAHRQTASVQINPSPIAVTVTPLATSSVGASNLIDEAVLTSNSSLLAVDPFTGALVPNTVVTVPDVPYATILRAHGSMVHSVANSLCGLAIVAEGGLIASRVDASYSYNGTPATNLVTAYPEALIDANSPGSYQLMLYSFTAGNMNIAASAAQKTWLRVFSA